MSASAADMREEVRAAIQVVQMLHEHDADGLLEAVANFMRLAGMKADPASLLLIPTDDRAH